MLQKQTAPANADAAYFGGGCGIRTHVGLLPNGFQDRLVMTASITLRMYVQVQTNLTFLIQFSRLRLVMSCCGARNFSFAIAHKISTAATPYASLDLPPAALGNVPASITLRMYVQVQTNLTFLIQFSRLRLDDPSSDFVPIILSHGGGFVKFSLCICGREVVY